MREADETMKRSGPAETLSALLLAAAVLTILYLTLQTPKQTSSLSHPFYEWFRSHGFKGTEHELRSLAHLPE